MDDIKTLTDLIQAETCHRPKENLVVTIVEVGNGGTIVPVLSLRSCSKSESDQFIVMMEAIFENLT